MEKRLKDMPSKKIIAVSGGFDPIHVGHVRMIQEAKKMGDELWVSITDDLHVLKGVGRPIHPQEHRLALIKGLRVVDKAFLCSSLIEAIDFVKPDILVKGIDYRDGLHEVHTNYCKKRGIEIRFTKTPKLSASDLIRAASENSPLKRPV